MTVLDYLRLGGIQKGGASAKRGLAIHAVLYTYYIYTYIYIYIYTSQESPLRSRLGAMYCVRCVMFNVCHMYCYVC